jgi:hypothetical protein
MVMHNEFWHPVLPVPPRAHALHHWDAETGTLRYEYNGQDIVTVRLPLGIDPGYRHGSDGTISSFPYVQQVYVQTDEPVNAVVEFSLSPGSIPLRPRRAGTNEAVLGMLGRPLLPGVNGLYDVEQDLLVDFAGAPWRWIENEVSDASGRAVATIAVELSPRPLYINIRPRYYREHLGFRNFAPWERRPKSDVIAGWCSWEAYRRDIDQEKISEAAEVLGRELGPWGLDIIQVDDGYQAMPLPSEPGATMADAWMTCRPDAFPEGHTGIVRAIMDKGMTPGIWLNANITGPTFAQDFPDAILWDGDEPLLGEWIDFIYSCTPESLAEHVEAAFARLREAGYTYVKGDAIRHLLLDGLHEAVRRGLLSDEDATSRFVAYMQAARKGLGEDVYLLAPWGALSEVAGPADACRIAMDANPTWAGVRMQLFESARWFHTHRVVFTNDPDHVCVRTEPEWARSALSLISLSGGLLMLSDPLDVYDDEALDIVRACLPPLETRTGETGHLRADLPAYTWTKLHGFAVQADEAPVRPEPVSDEEAASIAGVYPSLEDDHPFGALWAFHLSAAGESWSVAARFATSPLPAATTTLSALGLDEKIEMHAFDFWKQAYLGRVGAGAELAMSELAVGECQVVGLRPVLGRPQLVASTRHVSMDAVSVSETAWDGRVLRVELATIPGVENTYTFHTNGATLLSSRAQGANLTLEADGELLAASVLAEGEIAVLELEFEV